MTMARKSMLGVAMVMASLLAVAAGLMTSSVAIADDTTCDGTKKNPCPLQKWMIANMGPALAGGDNAALAKSLDKIAASSPDASWAWAQTAKKGADAARAGNIADVKAACKTCHDAHKESYRQKFQRRSFN